jgi:cation diffusion facilitator CzcD-associated flavoprotein CzcO
MTGIPDHADVVVIGSGFAGLAAAIKLREAGRDVIVIERGDDVGGTWRDNSYPGCACDVPSHLYSFSFAPNPDWSRSFSPQAEIYAYLQRTAKVYGVLPITHFGAELLAANWDDSQQRWHVRTNKGELTARVLVSGAGALSEPSVPALPGLESFTGTTFHSAAWQHDHALTGERVAVIGTGASAIQFVPHVQQRAAKVTVFQRTAPWVLPRRDRDIKGVYRRVYRRLPAAQRLNRAGIYSGRESWLVGFAIQPKLMKYAEKQALRYLRKQVPDSTLRAKLTPHYRLGCKRVLLSNDYFQALNQPNVDVVTDRIVEVLPRAVVTEDAVGARTEHPVDTIIFGTGFHVTDPPIAERIHGAAGRSLAAHWADSGMAALHGLAVSGFPNFFMLVGPNTGLGHSSIVYMIESQVHYLVDALRRMDASRVGAIEPRQDVQDAYNDRLQNAVTDTVWNTGGCASWYLDDRGRNTTLWPTFTFVFRRQLRECNLDEFVTHAPVRQPAKVAA